MLLSWRGNLDVCRRSSVSRPPAGFGALQAESNCVDASAVDVRGRAKRLRRPRRSALLLLLGRDNIMIRPPTGDRGENGSGRRRRDLQSHLVALTQGMMGVDKPE